MGVSMRLWQAPGCHEFLASLGFDLLDVGKDEVTVKAGKQANRRILQFGLQALVAIFGNNLLSDSILKLYTIFVVIIQRFDSTWKTSEKWEPCYLDASNLQICNGCCVSDTQEAPRTLFLDSSSSMESLYSSDSATSTSNFSKGSSPPTSPTSRKKSFFNPAEVEKLPSASRAHQVKTTSIVVNARY